MMRSSSMMCPADMMFALLAKQADGQMMRSPSMMCPADMMFALRANDALFEHDVSCGHDVCPRHMQGKHHIILTIGQNIIFGRRPKISLFAEQTTSFIKSAPACFHSPAAACAAPNDVCPACKASGRANDALSEHDVSCGHDVCPSGK